MEKDGSDPFTIDHLPFTSLPFIVFSKKAKGGS
jgi:hypothetical protein